MDETLYYVESPDGQVLGPMSMMHILEGVAAGAVLEEARICEVGAAEWVELADVAYTRHGPSRANLAMPRLDDAVVTGAATPAATPPPSAPASETPRIEDVLTPLTEPESDPVWAAEFEDALAALESEAMEAPEDTESIERTAFPAPELNDLPDTWQANATPPASEEAPVFESRSPFGSAPEFESTPPPDSGRDDGSPVSIFDPAFEAALLEANPVAEPTRPPSQIAPEGGPQWVEHAPRAAQPEPVDTRRDDMAMIEDTIVVGEPAGAPSPEFALQMEHADEEATLETAGAPRKFPVAIPALVAVALAALGGVYVLVSGKMTPGKPSAKPAASASAAATEDPVRDGWAALNAGRNAQALQLLQGAAEAQPENAHAHHGLALAALATGKNDVASAHLEKAIELSPKEAALHVDLGRVRLSEGRFELAVEEAQRAQALDANDVSALLLLGQAHAGAKRPNDAVKALTAFLKASPKNVDARRDLALALADAGRAGPAAEALGPYLEANPQDRAMQQQRLDWMLAVGQGTAAAKLYPMDARKDAFAQFLAGAARVGSEDAVECLDRAVDLDPNFREAWVRRADAYAAVGRPKEAVESMQRAFALSAGSAAEKRLIAQWNASAASSRPAVAASTPAPAATPATPPAAKTPEPTQASSAPATAPLLNLDAPAKPAAPAAKPAAPTAAVTLADRVEDIRRALNRADFTGARRTVEAGRADLGDAESKRNLTLWNAIVDFESGDLESAQSGFESLDASVSYLGFGKGAAANWLGRVLLARGQARAAIGAFDQVPAEDPNEYAAAQLWEGVAMSSLGMQDLATRTWGRIREDVGGRVGPSGKAWVQSADFLTGAITEKDYRAALSSSSEFENDMYFFLGWSVRSDPSAAKPFFEEAVKASRGKEFPYHLAEAGAAGTGIAK